LISLTLAILTTALATTPVIEMAGEEACPAPREVATRLAELVALEGPTIRALGVHLSRRGDRLDIEIDDPHGVRLVERSVPRTGSCADMARAVALVVASWAGEIGGAPADRSMLAVPATDSPGASSPRVPSARLEIISSERALSPGTSQVVVPAPGQPGDAVAPGRTQRALGLVVGGVGIASLVAGAIYGFAAESNDRAAENACLMAACGLGAVVAELDRAASDARKSEVYLGLGAGLVATGAIVYLLAPSVAEAGRASSVGVAPVAINRTAGVMAMARF
jgi:hypothetical protein